MKNLIVATVLLVLGACRFGPVVSGNGKMVKEQRQVEGFSKLDIGGQMEVQLVQGENYDVEVEAEENILPYIVTSKSGSELEIGLEHNVNIRTSKGIHITVTMPEIRGVDLSGSGSVKSSGRLMSNERLKLSIAGSGKMNMEVKAPDISVDIAGAGKVDIKGETRDLSVDIGGSGDLVAEDLLSENVKASIAGSGTARVYASSSLDVSVAGSGDVYYKGNPNVKKSIAGSGKVKPLQ